MTKLFKKDKKVDVFWNTCKITDLQRICQCCIVWLCHRIQQEQIMYREWSLLSPKSFSALTLLVGCQEEHPACKSWVMGCWCDYLSGARCRLFACGPADATAIQKLRHLLPHLNPDSFYLSVTGLPRLTTTAAKEMSSVSRHSIVWDECLWNDRFCVEWDVKLVACWRSCCCYHAVCCKLWYWMCMCSGGCRKQCVKVRRRLCPWSGLTLSTHWHLPLVYMSWQLPVSWVH